MARHTQIVQNNKFSTSLQYHKKEMSDEVDFLYADSHGNYLQTDAMTFDGNGQAFPKFPKYQVCNVFRIS